MTVYLDDCNVKAAVLTNNVRYKPASVFKGKVYVFGELSAYVFSVALE